MEEPLYAELQREVQRKLGRCLIRIQQYELLLKELLAKREVSGKFWPADSQPVQAEPSSKTMGQQVGELMGEYFQPTLYEGQNNSMEESADADSEVHPEGWGRVSMSVSMRPEAHAKMVEELQELVDLRNDLVHHFLEGQDLVSEVGCIAADMYLQDCYAEIDRHLSLLRSWVESSNEAKRSMAAFFSGPEFRDFLLTQMTPLQSEREAALPKFVDLLRQAEGTVAMNGWTSLKAAIEFAGTAAPDVVPKTYKFASWGQILHNARVFEVRRQPPIQGATGEIWYRSRPG
jgi:hypothetical protein